MPDRRAVKTVLAAACLALLGTTAPARAASAWQLVTTDMSPGSRPTYYKNTAISGDGKWAAYLAAAGSGLIPNDAEVAPPAQSQLVAVDLRSGKQWVVLKASCCLSSLSFSRDGRWLVFDSGVDNLVPGDVNKSYDVFLYDMKARRLSQMRNVKGGPLERGAEAGAITPDGKTVVYASWSDVFVKRNQQAPPCSLYKYSLVTRRTTAVLVAGNPVCSFPAEVATSSDGRYLAVVTMDSLVREDAGGEDVYWIDTVKHRAVLVSDPSVSGGTSDETSEQPTIDGAGRLVGWVSTRTGTAFGTQTDMRMLLRDVTSGRLIPVQYGLFGPGSNVNSQPRLSENGKWLTFTDNHGDASTTAQADLRAVYVRDLTKDVATTARIEPVGVCKAPACAHPSSSNAVPSGDGSRIVYLTNANLSERDTDQNFDVYVAKA